MPSFFAILFSSFCICKNSADTAPCLSTTAISKPYFSLGSDSLYASLTRRFILFLVTAFPSFAEAVIPTLFWLVPFVRTYITKNGPAALLPFAKSLRNSCGFFRDTVWSKFSWNRSENPDVSAIWRSVGNLHPRVASLLSR